MRHLVGAALVLAGCGSENPSPLELTMQADSTTVRASVDQKIDITLQSIGPGEFTSPPEIDSDHVKFIDVTLPSAQDPAGPTQTFHFEAASPGSAAIMIRHTDPGPLFTCEVDVSQK
jgi:hypothetical protein